MGKDLCKSVRKVRFCDIYQSWIKKVKWNGIKIEKWRNKN